MLRRLNIATKIVFILFSLITISILIFSYISFQVTKRSLEKYRIPLLESISDLKAIIIETYMEKRAADIKTAQNFYNIKVNLPIMSKYADDRTNPAYIAAKNMLDKQMKPYQTAHEYIDIMLVNKEGEIVYVTNEAHAKGDLDHSLPCPDKEKVFEEAKKGIYFTSIFKNNLEGYNYEMLITAPVHDYNMKFIGVIAFEISMEPLFKYILDTNGLGETGETFICARTSAGALFLHDLRHDSEAALQRNVAFGENIGHAAQQAVMGRNGHGITTDYRGKEVLAVWRYIPFLDWGLVSKMDKQEAFGLVAELRIVTIVSGVCVLFFALIGAVFFSRTITGPVKKLSDMAYKISKGDLSEHIKIKGKDEISLLARSFDTMRVRIAKLLKSVENAKQDWESTFNSVKDIIVLYDRDCKIIRFNNEMLSRLNARPEDIIGKRCYEVFYDNKKEREEHKHICEVVKVCKTRKPSAIEKELTILGGQFLLSIFPRYSNEGKFLGVVQVIKDITEHKMAQDLLIRSHKMSSLGQQAAGVCHEILNPVNIIASHVQLMLMEAEEGSVIEKDAKSIQDEIVRITKITDSLLRYSRSETPETEEIEIKGILEKTILLVEPSMKIKNIQIIKKIDEELPDIKVNINQLRQVFLNLMRNAGDAMPEGGTLIVKIQSVKLPAGLSMYGKKTLHHSYRNSGEFIEITFEDTGCGVAGENLEKIFEPFFTTKKEGEGTGLGLSESFKIVENHGGTLTVHSKEGEGSAFRVYLPIMSCKDGD